jgi:hypothetical protein
VRLHDKTAAGDLGDCERERMSDDRPPFFVPNRGPAPPRQPQPGEQVWRLRPLLLVAARELMGAYRSSTIVGLDRAPIDAGLPIPDPAQASSPATSSSPNTRDVLETAWLPHRDAPSLLGVRPCKTP